MITAEAFRRNLRLLPALVVLALLIACGGLTSVYKAYEGEPRQAMQISTVAGAQYMRQDWMIRYVDSVRFSHVDGNFIEHSESFSAIEIAPGFHDLRVYFFWDLGNQRGLGPALVSYSSTRDTLSRTLRFNARAGESYTVRAQPVFNQVREEITTLQHVDFWVEDGQGNQIVSRAAGRYVPAQ